MNMTNAEADIQFSAWSGACYIMPLVGGYISETYLGRYKTILVFCMVYLVGLVLIVVGSIPDNARPLIVFPAIYVIAIGTGGIKPNVSTFGADQFDDRYLQDRTEKESFFNWFYWSINIGTAFSFTLISYVCQYGIPGLGGANWGFFWGYLIVTISMVMAIIVYMSGTPKYDCEKGKPQGSVVGTTMKIYWNAFWVNRTVEYGSDTMDSLDRASLEFGGNYTPNQVQCVKLVTRLFPFLGVLVCYWGLYSQMVGEWRRAEQCLVQRTFLLFSHLLLYIANIIVVTSIYLYLCATTEHGFPEPRLPDGPESGQSDAPGVRPGALRHHRHPHSAPYFRRLCVPLLQDERAQRFDYAGQDRTGVSVHGAGHGCGGAGGDAASEREGDCWRLHGRSCERQYLALSECR